MSSFHLIFPYAVWMVLMSLLPSTASAYAVRTVVTLLALAVSVRGLKLGANALLPRRKDWLYGLGAGVLVLLIWVLPEYSEFYRRYCILGDVQVSASEPSPYDPQLCGWPLTVVRLLGSAFVIAAAEEMFFRRWLIGFAGFVPMVVLFAIEHDRPLVAALAGAIYGWCYLRQGLKCAVLAHMTTNLALGIWVIWRGAWAFW